MPNGFFAWSHESTDVQKNPHTPHAEGVDGEAASEQAVTYMLETRALLLLRSKKWAKSR
jgi:hypothetical protein